MKRSDYEILWHSLGMDAVTYRRPLSWWLGDGNHRNLFCACCSGRVYPILLDLVADGVMTLGQFINEGRDRYFHVSPKGIEMARNAFAAEQRTERAKRGPAH